MKRQLKFLVENRFPAVSVCYRKLRDEWLYATAKPYQSKLGFTIHGDFSQHYTQGDAISERLKSNEIERFETLLADAEAFIDIGANIGVFSLLAARKGVPGVAVEAHPRNYQNLLLNLKANDLAGIECYNIALSNEVGCVSLFGSGEMASLTESWGGNQANHSVLVASTTLDNLIGERFAGKRLLIKMDVEGHEYQVLQGAEKVLGKSPAPVWQFEHGYRENFVDVNLHYLAVLERFWSAGYVVRPADGGAPLDPAHVCEIVAQGEDPCPDCLNFVAAREE